MAASCPPDIILGIDPGTVMMGYGLICRERGGMRFLDMGSLRLSGCRDPYERLQRIHEKVSELIASHRATVFAIEAPFFGKNVQSMLKLGRAQGVAIAAAMQAGLPVCEYAPKKIKQSITGHGNASKEQVALMLKRLLQFGETPAHMDATDALAVAVCHHFQQRLPPSTGGSGGWKAYIRQHPEKVRNM